MNGTVTIYDSDTDREVEVSLNDYIKAKTKDLRAFGYPDLTEDHLREQVERYLNGTPREQLNVIGMFASRDIVLPD